jgi:dTDP-4-amino-4,6-dideoxygalactose transaminase
MTVPLHDPRREHAELAPELLAAAERVLSSGRYILGPEVEGFEREAARYLGIGNAIGVASGTDALWLALKAAGVRPGDLVLTSPFSFFSTAASIVNVGATPVFADIDERTFNLDARSVQEVLEDRTSSSLARGLGQRFRAIVVVHLFGQPADMAPILRLARERDLVVIEDAVQAMGAEYQGRKAGTLGDAGCFSFFPTKNLGGFGDGGLVVTAAHDLAARVRMLRTHGAVEKHTHRVVGLNSRLDALQAALLRVKLGRLDGSIAARRARAAAYDASFQDVQDVTVPYRAAGRTHSFHQYVIRLPRDRRARIRHALQRAGIETAVHYPRPLHLQEAIRFLGYAEGDLPVAEAASQEVLSLPISPHLSPDEQERVIEALRTSITAGSGTSRRAGERVSTPAGWRPRPVRVSPG